MSESHTITEMLARWNADDRQAWDALLPDIYQAVKQKAKNMIGKQIGPCTLHPTALVNELYIEFKQLDKVQWKNRQHFFAVVALVMRQIIIDRARRDNAEKRGGKQVFVTTALLAEVAKGDELVDLIALDKALNDLEHSNSECLKIVELRYFAGLTVAEIADLLSISERKVYYHWNWAKAWLHKQLFSA